MCIEYFTSKDEARGLSDGKKGSRLQLCFRVINDNIPEKKEIKLWRQMSSKWSFTCICRIFLPLNPPHDYSLCSVCSPHSAFYPSLRFTFSLQSALYTQSAFLPLVRSLHSTVHSLHCTLTEGKFINAEGKVQNCILGYSAMQFIVVLLGCISIMYLRHTSTKLIVTSSRVTKKKPKKI